jgi:hypothetical protein
MDSLKRFLAPGLQLVATIFFIAATAAPRWAETSTTYAGLWDFESKTRSVKTELSSSDLIDCAKGDAVQVLLGWTQEQCQEVLASRAFNVLAILLSSFALICMLLPMILPSAPAAAKSSAKFLSLGAFVCGLIGFATIIHAYITGFSGTDPAACAPLSVIAWFFSLVAGIWGFLTSPGGPYAAASQA